ncbi:MAG: hypothetical protein U9R25_09495 [Chloroflexota bacterium]|nr:hypothetical protein [Chloroflexota bacterium]
MSNATVAAGRQTSRSSDFQEADVRQVARRRFNIYPFLLFLLSVIAWAPLLYPGYFQVHSGFLAVFNLEQLAGSGNKLRWLPTLGEQAGSLAGEGPLAYWLASLVQPFWGGIVALKVVFGLSIVMGGLGAYLWIRLLATTSARDKGLQVFAERAGVLAGTLLMFWPYLLSIIYLRGVPGEALFLACLPWVLWAINHVRIVAGSDPAGQTPEQSGTATAGWLTAIAVGIVLLFLSQPGLALWASVILLAWAFWPAGTRSGRLPAAAAIAAGLLLGSVIDWLLHGSLTLAGGDPGGFGDHAVHPYQLFSSLWQFGGSTPDWKGDPPFQLGLAAVGLAMLAALLLFDGGREGATQDSASKGYLGGRASHDMRYAVVFALLAVLVVTLFATTLARPLWSLLPFLSTTLAYPWQLLVLAGPWLALAAGSVILLERRLAAQAIWAALLAFVVLSSYGYLAPRYTQSLPDLHVASIFGDETITLLTANVAQPAEAAIEDTGAIDSPSGMAGEALTITVDWQALQPVEVDYNVFVHAVDENGSRVAQWDGPPQLEGQSYPTTGWALGEIVSNVYRLEIDPGRAGDVRQIYLGLYDWQTGQRLPANGDDKVVLEVGS